MFRHTNQERFESVEKFYMRLMQLAATCNFTETSSEIKSQLIAGSINDKITRKGLSEPDLSLDKLLQFAKTLELTDSQNKAVRRTSQTTTVNHVNDSRQRGKQPPNRPKQKRNPARREIVFQLRRQVAPRGRTDAVPCSWIPMLDLSQD